MNDCDPLKPYLQPVFWDEESQGFRFPLPWTQDNAATSILITSNGTSPAKFIDGYTPVRIAQCSELWILQIIDVIGNRSNWILDSNGCFITNQPGPDIAPTLHGQSKVFVDSILQYIEKWCAELLASSADRSDDAATALDIFARDFLIQLFSSIKHYSNGISILNATSESAVLEDLLPAVSLSRLTNILSSPTQQLFSDIGTLNAVSCPNPYHESDLSLYSSRAIYLSPRIQCYYFYDKTSRSVFYLVISCQRVCALYFPSKALIVSDSKSIDLLKSGNSDIRLLLLEHISTHARDISCYLKSSADARPGIILTQKHLGHHVWNDLSEVYYQAAISSNCNILTLGYQISPHTQLGLIEDLFPELYYSPLFYTDNYNLCKFLYASRVLPYVSQRSYIYSALSGRIQKCALIQFKAESLGFSSIGEISSTFATIAVFGLRSENRYPVNAEALLFSTINLLNSTGTSALLLIDGMNTSANTMNIPIHAMILRAQNEFVAKALDYALGTRVHIISMIGRTVQDSIAACMAADFFISPWGAGLAKYAWICKKPGLVMSSKWNMLMRSDHDIYDNPIYSEDPSKIIYLDPEFVDDICDDKTLISYPDHDPLSLANYYVDEESFRLLVCNLLADLTKLSQCTPLH